MMDLAAALQLGITALGAVGGGYLGVKLSVARLEGRVSVLESEVSRLRQWHEDHGAALPNRMTNAESNITTIRANAHQLVKDISPVVAQYELDRLRKEKGL